MKQQRNFITFRKSVNYPETAFHQGLHRLNHHIPEFFVKRRFEFTDFLCETGKTPSVQPRNHIHIRQDTLIYGLLIYPHFTV